MDLPNVVERWFDAFQDRFDLDDYLDLFEDDVTFFDGETGRMIHGKQDLTEFVRPFTQLSELSATLLSHATNEDKTFLEGELRGRVPTGQEMRSRGVGVFHTKGPKITSFAMYMFRQNIQLDGSPGDA